MNHKLNNLIIKMIIRVALLIVFFSITVIWSVKSFIHSNMSDYLSLNTSSVYRIIGIALIIGFIIAFTMVIIIWFMMKPLILEHKKQQIEQLNKIIQEEIQKSKQ